MSGTFLSILSGWWTRLLARGRRRQAVAVTLPSVKAAGVTTAARAVAVVAEPVAPTAGEAPPRDIDGAADNEQLLLEMIQVEALPGSERLRVAPDPLVRERTLAALGNLRQIPALQSLAQGFARATSRVEVSIDEVVESLEKDSALCVRVLRMANSAFVASEQRIESLATAVHMLGVVRVRTVAQALFTLRDARRVADGFDWRHLWIHAFATAAIAEELERQLRPGGESQLHLAALLHDVGKIVLSTIAPDEYRDILVCAWNSGGRLEDLERDRLGVDHREAGVMFASHNQLPDIVVEAVAHHARPEVAASYRFEVALVSLANHISKAYGLGFSGSRLHESDGEFSELTAWQVIKEECGYAPDVEAIEEGMRTFVTKLRPELHALRE